MKGIVLAAGRGTRLYPMTQPVCKPLLPVYDKPLIYYPVSLLMQAGIRDIMVIVPPGETERFRALLGDGSQFGIHMHYAEQAVPRGTADALLIGSDFIGDDRVCLVLGDNLFHAPTLSATLKAAAAREQGATVFGYWVEDPRPFGVVEFDESGRAVSIEEKPARPKSHYILPGLYFFDRRVTEIAKTLQPSPRGELEITDVVLDYLHHAELQVMALDRDVTWLDAGTADSLLRAGDTVRRIQAESGRYVGCPEEIGLAEGWLSPAQVHELGKRWGMTPYGQYLQNL